MDDRVKVAVAGFNFGLMGYMLIRWLPTLSGRAPVDFGWFMTQLLIGAVIGAAVGGVAFFVMSRK